MSTPLEQLQSITKSLKLLYIEDNPTVRLSTSHMLGSFFDTIIIAEDGQQGLDAFSQERPDIIITDLEMPNMNGMSMIKCIREVDRSIPIVIFSSLTDVDYFIETIEYGIQGYLTKPVYQENFINILMRVTDSFRLKRELEKQNKNIQHYQEITDKSLIISKLDLEGNITYVNDIFCEFTHYTKEEIIGKPYKMLLDETKEPMAYQTLWDTISNAKSPYQGVLKNSKKNKEPYYSKTSIVPIYDSDNTLEGFIAMHIDITETMQPIAKMHDYISACQEPTLILVKIEGYNDLKTYFGNDIGLMIEEKLVKILQNKQKTLLPNANIYPIGQGEITFVLDEGKTPLDREKLQQDMRALQTDIDSQSIAIKDMEYDASILISVASGQNIYESAMIAIEKIEQSPEKFIYAHDYVKEVKKSAKENIDKLVNIKYAIENRGIISYFQPIIDNKSKEVLKYESLVRMIDKSGKVLSPFHFLEVSKKAKYYSKITDIVLQNSFEALLLCKHQISINISIQDIERPQTKALIFEMIKKYKAQAHRIVFELLEDESVVDFDAVVAFISDVKSQGVQIAIDDFGSGYSNYQRLIHYQPDILKIDGSLIVSIDKDPYVRSVVAAIVAFAQENNIATLAEYVENESIYNTICEMGIDYSQGYYFSAPLPLAKICI